MFRVSLFSFHFVVNCIGLDRDREHESLLVYFWGFLSFVFLEFLLFFSCSCFSSVLVFRFFFFFLLFLSFSLFVFHGCVW